ncbi:MAG: phytanoyl-CoA dioxygenase family protein [Planctomycetes bacterium]|nr:phytanoyl-CoA dioxygenase family protein [Planctomycetota bacterium]
MTKEQRISWQNAGFVVVEDALSPEELQRARTVFDSEMEKAQAARKENTPGKVESFSLANPLDLDDVFVDMADNPKVLPILTAGIGPDLVLTMVQAFTTPPGGSPVYWHSDLWHFAGVDLTHDCYFARVIYFLDDVEPGGGAFAYLPGSHRLDTLALVHPPKFDDPKKMPNCVEFAVRAGTAVIFNAYGLHARLPNRSNRTRKAVQYGYCHAWVKFLDKPQSPKDTDRLARNDLRKQIFGLKPVEYSYEYIDKMIKERQKLSGG